MTLSHRGKRKRGETARQDAGNQDFDGARHEAASLTIKRVYEQQIHDNAAAVSYEANHDGLYTHSGYRTIDWNGEHLGPNDFESSTHHLRVHKATSTPHGYTATLRLSTSKVAEPSNVNDKHRGSHASVQAELIGSRALQPAQVSRNNQPLVDPSDRPFEESSEHIRSRNYGTTSQAEPYHPFRQSLQDTTHVVQARKSEGSQSGCNQYFNVDLHELPRPVRTKLKCMQDFAERFPNLLPRSPHEGYTTRTIVTVVHFLAALTALATDLDLKRPEEVSLRDGIGLVMRHFDHHVASMGRKAPCFAVEWAQGCYLEALARDKLGEHILQGRSLIQIECCMQTYNRAKATIESTQVVGWRPNTITGTHGMSTEEVRKYIDAAWHQAQLEGEAAARASQS